jgi:hypothetical protein
MKNKRPHLLKTTFGLVFRFFDSGFLGFAIEINTKSCSELPQKSIVSRGNPCKLVPARMKIQL